MLRSYDSLQDRPEKKKYIQGGKESWGKKISFPFLTVLYQIKAR